MKNIGVFYLNIFQFLEVKFSIYLNRRVLVMFIEFCCYVCQKWPMISWIKSFYSIHMKAQTYEQGTATGTASALPKRMAHLKPQTYEQRTATEKPLQNKWHQWNHRRTNKELIHRNRLTYETTDTRTKNCYTGTASHMKPPTHEQRTATQEPPHIWNHRRTNKELLYRNRLTYETTDTRTNNCYTRTASHMKPQTHEQRTATQEPPHIWNHRRTNKELLHRNRLTYETADARTKNCNTGTASHMKSQTHEQRTATQESPLIWNHRRTNKELLHRNLLTYEATDARTKNCYTWTSSHMKPPTHEQRTATQEPAHIWNHRRTNKELLHRHRLTYETTDAWTKNCYTGTASHMKPPTHEQRTATEEPSLNGQKKNCPFGCLSMSLKGGDRT